MNQKQLELIGHSLGINVYHAQKSKKKSDKKLPKEYYRNYFQADKGHSSFSDLQHLVSIGLMTNREQFGQMVFHVTDEGKEMFKNAFNLSLVVNLSQTNS
jgi:hypothetical protein